MGQTFFIDRIDSSGPVAEETDRFPAVVDFAVIHRLRDPAVFQIVSYDIPSIDGNKLIAV